MNVSMPYLDQNINLCCNETFNLLYLDTQVGVRFSILKSNLDLFCICNLNVSQLLVNSTIKYPQHVTLLFLSILSPKHSIGFHISYSQFLSPGLACRSWSVTKSTHVSQELHKVCYLKPSYVDINFYT